MPVLALQNFQTIVNTSAAAVQKSSSKLLNLGVGSVLRAILEANAAVALWMQRLIVQVWAGSRLGTSTSADVDSWVEDFGLTRQPSVAARGTATFSRFSAGISALILPGTQVITTDQTQTFTVDTDTTNGAWNPTMGGYFVPAGTLSVDVPVVAEQAGISGNIQAGAISLIASAIPGIETVTNAAPMGGGEDAESDDALKERFQVYVVTRARATPVAVAYAIVSVQQGLSYAIAENSDAAGNYRPGNFIVVVDDGTGAPSASLISTIYAAVDQVRPIGSTFMVRGPDIVPVSISMTISVRTAAQKPALQGIVQAAVLDYVNTLTVGEKLLFATVVSRALNADPGITNVTSVLLNGTTSDVDPGKFGVIKASSVTIN